MLGFLSLNATDILDQIILCCEDCPMQWGNLAASLGRDKMSPDIAECPLGEQNHPPVLLLYLKRVIIHTYFTDDKTEAQNSQEAGPMS